LNTSQTPHTYRHNWLQGKHRLQNTLPFDTNPSKYRRMYLRRTQTYVFCIQVVKRVSRNNYRSCFLQLGYVVMWELVGFICDIPSCICYRMHFCLLSILLQTLYYLKFNTRIVINIMSGQHLQMESLSYNNNIGNVSLELVSVFIKCRIIVFLDEMVMWSPSQTGGFPPGTPVSSHTKTIGTQTSVPTSMINISCITCFVIVVK